MSNLLLNLLSPSLFPNPSLITNPNLKIQNPPKQNLLTQNLPKQNSPNKQSPAKQSPANRTKQNTNLKPKLIANQTKPTPTKILTKPNLLFLPLSNLTNTSTRAKSCSIFAMYFAHLFVRSDWCVSVLNAKSPRAERTGLAWALRVQN